MDLEGNRYLVTGAAGFIGSHLTESLLNQGGIVDGVDSFTDYYAEAIKRQNIEGFLTDDKFELVEQNITELPLRDRLPEYDGIFHLAAQAGVRASWGEEFDEYIHQNIRATQVLLEATKDSAPDCPILLASSSSVYGVPDRMPMVEDMPAQPYSPYGVTKLAAENLGMLYHRNFGLNVTALRFFTVYGPRQRPDMAFSRFLTWVKRGQPITVYGDGSQTRDFSYVEDVVRALETAYRSDSWGDIFNVGGGNRVSINEIIELLEEVTGKKVHRRQEPMPEGDVPHTDADTGRIKDSLGWSPEVSLRQGLSNQWDWIRNNDTVLQEIPTP
ncbi:MAG: GDP-mannose 4,6-dehydratase [bacterium]